MSGLTFAFLTIKDVWTHNIRGGLRWAGGRFADLSRQLVLLDDEIGAFGQ